MNEESRGDAAHLLTQEMNRSSRASATSARLLVTGGAGFIGSHLIDVLLNQGHEVVCVDDLSLGREDNIVHHADDPHFTFHRCDMLDTAQFSRIVAEWPFDCVFHMAANSDIQMGMRNTDLDLRRTFMTTFQVLNLMGNHGIKEIVFPSSSAVYGEHASSLREDSGPCLPVSLYGAAKLSSEAYISAFCANEGIRAWIVRFPNVVGERATHGAMFDFIGRLERDSRKLVILGDGRQSKPYTYVRDLVRALVHVWRSCNEQVNCFNVAAEGTTTVTRLAQIVVEEMGLADVVFEYTGGDRGWVGDVPRFKYDLTKIHSIGWKAQHDSDEAVRTAVRAELARRRSGQHAKRVGFG